MGEGMNYVMKGATLLIDELFETCIVSKDGSRSLSMNGTDYTQC
jgi:hypothetical protein